MEGNGASSSEDDDPVVRSFDVFLSQNLASQLHVFQYPLYNHPPDMTSLVEMRMKPLHHLVEMQLNIAQSGPYYNPTSQTPMTTEVMSGTHVPHNARYALGLCVRDQIHLTPISEVTPLRPNFTNYNNVLAAQKRENLAAAAAITGEETEPADAEADDLKPVQLQFRRRESDKALHARLNSYSYMQQREAEEPWVELQRVETNTKKSRAALEQLQCHPLAPPLVMERGDTYLAAVHPPTIDPTAVRPTPIIASRDAPAPVPPSPIKKSPKQPPPAPNAGGMRAKGAAGKSSAPAPPSSPSSSSQFVPPAPPAMKAKRKIPPPPRG
eukprot:gnl/Spiro4/22738_TR11230_c0_g1_i1.p1 gnl/Spiro4/22738_TR11230_c0_g1~~gnl/Spiro4/22738_TR11230_c0_g1_i1.p1  ORF type:complete len:343 (-),score=81.01 gnl/Spiro4/22738_TR11230_c0_g1_i1:55-1029(-)